MGYGNFDIQDIMNDPNKFGIPTFEETQRKYYNKRDRMYGRADERAAAIDAGDKALGLRQKYYVEHCGRYRTDSIEQAERVIRDMGFDMHRDFIGCPQVRDDDGLYIEVTFKRISSLKDRQLW